jgi:hypothetical protein
MTHAKNDPSTNILSTLIVPICSIVNGQYHDPSCLLGLNDHPFLRHNSYADYYRASIQPVDAIVHGVGTGEIIPKPAVSDLAFGYLGRGLSESKRTSTKNLHFFNS